MEVIDDIYWLNFAHQGVTNSITSRNDAASKLETLVTWFWTIYTTAFIAGVTINALDAPKWILILMASPIVTLIITYWLCVWAQLPIVTTFDPRIPFEIKEGYNFILKKKIKRFNASLWMTLLSALIVAFSLTAFSFQENKASNKLLASFSENGKLIYINGRIPKDKDFTISIDSLKDKSKQKFNFYSSQFNSLDEGHFYINIPTNEKTSSILVNVLWSENGYTTGLATRINRKTPVKSKPNSSSQN